MNGLLSKEELQEGINILFEKYGQEGELKDIDDLIKNMDLDGNGNVDIKEFITATINYKEM